MAHVKKDLLFITVIGHDQKGIVARISHILYRHGINIEDISQKIMDSYFVMIMLVDITEATCSLEKLNRSLQQIAATMHLTIQVQHEEIFKMMHRI